MGVSVKSTYTNLMKIQLDKQSVNRTRNEVKKFARESQRLLNSVKLNIEGNTKIERIVKATTNEVDKQAQAQEKLKQKADDNLKSLFYTLERSKQLTQEEKKLIAERVKSAKTLADQRLIIRTIKDEQKDSLKLEKERTKELIRQSKEISQQKADRLQAAKNAGAGIGAGVMVAAGVGGVMISSSMERAKELDFAMNKSGVSAAELQNFAAAGGVDVDTAGDVLKDLLDKAGDWKIGDAGGMVDLGEYLIKHNKGLTKDTLTAMKPLQLLSKIQETFRRTNISQQESTFLLESMASDLSPILNKMGKTSFSDVAAQREKYGLNLTESEVKTLVEAQKNVSMIGEGLGRLSDAFLVGFGDGSIQSTMSSLKELQGTFESFGGVMRSIFDFLSNNTSVVFVALAAAATKTVLSVTGLGGALKLLITQINKQISKLKESDSVTSSNDRSRNKRSRSRGTPSPRTSTPTQGKWGKLVSGAKNVASGAANFVGGKAMMLAGAAGAGLGGGYALVNNLTGGKPAGVPSVGGGIQEIKTSVKVDIDVKSSDNFYQTVSKISKAESTNTLNNAIDQCLTSICDGGGA